MSWLRIREMVRKEFIQLFRDKRSRPILVIAPLIQLLVFGYVVNYDIKDIRVALIDQSRTRESRLMTDAFTASGIFRITNLPGNPGEMEELLFTGKVDLGIKIPPDFSDRIRRGETADVQILADGSMSNMASVRISYTVMVLDRLNASLIKELYGRDLKYGKIDGRIRTWYNPNLDSQNFFVPGIVAFVVMLIALLMTSIAIIKERENGTMEQLIVTPLKPIELIIGKTIPYTSDRSRPDGLRHALRHLLVRGPARREYPGPLPRDLSLSPEHPRRRALHLDGIEDPAAGDDDDLLLHPPLLHALRVRLSHRQHARNRPVVDIPQPFALFSRHHPGNLPQGGRAAYPLASVCGPGDPRHRGLCRSGGAVQEAAGLRRVEESRLRNPIFRVRYR